MITICIYNCLNTTKKFIISNYKDKRYNFIECSSLEEIYIKCKNNIEPILIIFDASCVKIKDIHIIRSMKPNVVFLALFNEVETEKITLFINEKSIDYIDFLPLKSNKSIEKAIEKALLLKIENKSINNFDNVNILTELEIYPELKDMIILKYIYDLIYGYVSDVDTINYMTYILGLKKVPNVVLTLIVDDFWDISINYNNKQKYYIKRMILNLTKEATKEYHSVTCSLIGTDKLIILLDCSNYSSETVEEEIIEIANLIRKYIKTNSKYTVTLGISSIYNDYKSLWKGYEEAYQAVNSSFNIGNDTVVHYKDIKYLEVNKLENYDFIDFEFDFFKNLSRNDTKAIFESYDRLFNKFCNMNYRDDIIKPVLYKFIYDISQYYITLGLDDSVISFLAIETIIYISKTSSITTARRYGKMFVLDLSKKYLELTSNDNLLSINAAIVFTNKYYYKNIKLSDAAYVSNMSPTYFSRKFKEEYGINFVNYLQKIRLEKSKELLIESNLSIKDIAFRVGFNDVAYFSKTFKLNYNISPSYYRKKYTGYY